MIDAHELNRLCVEFIFRLVQIPINPQYDFYHFDGKVEKRYYISSLLLDICNFSKAIRNHWNVENKLHWQLDFTFKADDNTTVNKKALFNLQIVKKFALNILNQVKEEYKCSLRKIRFQISLNATEELEKIFKLMKEKLEN